MKSLNDIMTRFLFTILFLLPGILSAQFSDSGINFQPVYQGDSFKSDRHFNWADFDNDGDLDLLLTGNVSSSTIIAKIYRNENAGQSFTDLGNLGLPSVERGSVDWGDYDNDGDLDVLLTGDVSASSTSHASRIYRNDNGSFQDIGAGLRGVIRSSAVWGDYDNDGYLDVLLMGQASNNSRISRIYRNNGDDTFSYISKANLVGLSQGSCQWGDYDNDGDLDILIAGTDGNVDEQTRIYRNDGDGDFVDIGAGLVGISEGSVAWGDSDSDGDLDALVVGNEEFRLYVNNGNDSFSSSTIDASPEPEDCAAAWGDHDNDGDLDILISGSLSSSPGTRVYRNNGGNSFSNINASLPAAEISAVAWADYDNDGDLDFLVAGRSSGSNVTKLYRNDASIANTPPTGPPQHSPVVNGHSVQLSWSTGFDGQTPASTLTYDIMVGTSFGSIDVVSPPADVSTGYRKIARMGTMSQGRTWQLKNLLPGTYYWEIQAVDNTFASSGFTSTLLHMFFTIDDPLGSIAGWVWNDTNNNGMQDSGEAGLNGVSIALKDSSNVTIATTTTAGDGDYSFPDLFEGHYTVEIDDATLPAGAEASFDIDGPDTPHVVTFELGVSENRNDIDFGYFLDLPLSADAGTDQAMCPGGSAQIGGSPTANDGTEPYSYSWSPTTDLDDPAAANPIASPTTTMTYMVTVTDDIGQTASDEVTITVNPLPTVIFNPVESFCVDASAVDLSGSVSPTGGTFSGPGISGNDFDPATAGVGTHTITYSFTDEEGCSNSAERSIVVNALPTATVSGDATICVGESATIQVALTGTGPWSLTWSDGTVQNDIATSPATRSVNPSVTTTYNVTDVSAVSGCSNMGSGSATITVLPIPVADAGPDVAVCENGAAQIGGDPTASDGTGDYTYSWTPADGLDDPSISNPTASPSATTDYTVTVTDANNKTAIDTVTVTVNPLPTVTFTPIGPFCINDVAVDLSGAVSPVGGTFSGTGISGNDFDPAVAGIGTHTVTYTFTNQHSCTNSVSQDIVVTDLPTVSFDPVGPFYVYEPAVDLSAFVSPAGGTFSGAGITGNDFDPGVAGVGTHTISYTFTDGTGCSNSAAQDVTVNPLTSALLATNSINLNLSSDILSGDIIVNDASIGNTLTPGYELTIGVGATTPAGYAVKADRIQVKMNATVASDVFYDTLNNKGAITGTLNQGLALPVITPLPPFQSALAGSQNITVATNDTITLDAGDYGAIEVKQNGTILFTGGVYNLRSLDAGIGAKLLFASSGDVRIEDKFAADQNSFVGPDAASGISASDIIFYVNGKDGELNFSPKAAKIGMKASAFANFYVPNGTLWLRQGANVTGAFLAKDINVGNHVQVTLDSYFGLNQ